MKTFFLLTLLSVAGMGSQIHAQQLAMKPGNAVSVEMLQWDSKHIELGEIFRNQPATLEFQFTNISPEAVVIESIRTSCGCTAAKHSDKPVLPGEKSVIQVEYDAKKPGAFRKSVSVQTTANEKPEVLVLSGKVV